MKIFTHRFALYSPANHVQRSSKMWLNMYVSFPLLLLTSLYLSTGCQQKHSNGESAVSEIRRVLAQQQSDWNEGSVERYMEGYWNSDSVRFASGGNVSYGWKTMLQRYKKRYPDRVSMGKLFFSDLRIEILTDTVALVFGRWRLLRKSDTPSGLFTLVFRKREKLWKIVSDHTSAAE